MLRWNATSGSWAGLTQLGLHPVVDQVHQAVEATQYDKLQAQLSTGWTEFVAVGVAVSSFAYGVVKMASHKLT